MDEIYKNYSKLVYNYLYTLTHDIEISEELMQETFYSAIKGINNFKNECNISVWLCQIAKNKWKNYWRKNKKIKQISIDDKIENYLISESIEEYIDKNNEKLDFYKEIHKLDERSKELFYLRIYSEFSFKQIGEILGKSENWARVTFYRVKIKLKEAYKNNENKK